MTNQHPLRLGVATALATALLPAALFAQAAPSTPPSAAVALSPPLAIASEAARLYVDSVGATVWARGDGWKASFAADGCAFVPFLGSLAPHNFPLRLQLLRVTAGDRELPLELTNVPCVSGQRVTIARGPLAEVYALSPAHVEQLFVFDHRVGDGDLTVQMRVDTELAVAPGDDGSWCFRNDLGGVRYGRATAVDAGQHTSVVASRCRDGVLTLTVPAAFVAAASFPLTIDPILLFFGLARGTATITSWGDPDGAYVGTYDGIYATVFEEAYSQTDHDIYLRPIARSGQQSSGLYIDYTTDYWSTPQIASHRGASQFLVVAARGQPTGNTMIWGRTVGYAVSGGAVVLTPGAQFPVHNFLNGKNPDVGGDANASPPLPGNYCVTWEGQWNGELYYNIVRTDGSVPLAGGHWLDPGPEFVSNPRIGKSCGVGAYPTQEWIVVWQKRYSPTDEDIYGSVIGVDGTLRLLQFLIDYSGNSDTNPEVSSKTDLIGGVQRFLVTYERLYPGTILQPVHSGLIANLFTGTTSLSGSVNLSALLGASSLRHQIQPCVDTDGSRFAIGYSDWSALVPQDTAPYLATVHVAGNTLGVTSFPELTNGYAGPDDNLQLTSERSGGTSGPRYLAVWTTTLVPGGTKEAGGSLYFGHSNLPPSAYFNQALPGCGPLTLAATGLPALGDSFTLTLTGAQGLPFLLLGTSVAPVPVCAGCSLGIDTATMIAMYTTNHTITVPTDSALIGYQLAAQGLDLFAPGFCVAPLAFALSNEIIVTVL